MNAVTYCVKDARRNIGKNGRRLLSAEKKTARRTFRSRLKAADRNTGFDGYVRPTFTAHDIT